MKNNRKKSDTIIGIGIIAFSLILGYFSITGTINVTQDMPYAKPLGTIIIITISVGCFLLLLLGSLMLRDGIKKR